MNDNEKERLSIGLKEFLHGDQKSGFELGGLRYSPKPTFEFYRAYREQINHMKEELDASLQADNAAFYGFLMMCMESYADSE